MRSTQSLLALAAFAVAAVLCYVGAVWADRTIETRTAEIVHERMSQAGLDWAHVRADGLMVHLTGTAPTEADRFKAISVASTEVDPTRVSDDMSVTPPKGLTPPRFSVEVLRNDDGISLIGLVPTATGHDPILEKVRPLAAHGKVTDMLETSDYAKPQHWDAALDFGLEALKLLPRSKVSISADRVSVTSIADSAAEKRSLEARLGRMAPDGVKVAIDIAAPRPVITPFTLRFVVDQDGAHFDACSADTEAVREKIIAAAVKAGAKGKQSCTVGMGVPSPYWGKAAVAGIDAVTELGRGSITFSDADVTLLVPASVPQKTYDRVVGELGANLPDVFSLKARRERKAEAAKNKGPAQFTATLSGDGHVQLHGRLGSELMHKAVTSFARAAFGADKVYNAARVDPDLPDGWPVRVMAGLEALADLHDGSLLVTPDTVEVRGVSGRKDASDEISRVLSDKLGQGSGFKLDVKYDKKFDPLAALPGPQECVDAVNAILKKRQITFDPGSDRIDAAAAKTMDAIADALRPCTRVHMEVAGYTDNQGRAEMNLKLSQARAEAVLKALLARRVPVGNFVAKGYGETDPIADNSTEAGREANRRIEFSLIKPAKKAGDTADPGDGGAAKAGATGTDAGGNDKAGADAEQADAAQAGDQAGDGGGAGGDSAAPGQITIRPKLRP